MLNFYHRMATLLAPGFWLVFAGALASGLVFVWQLWHSSAPHQSSVLFWLLLMLVCLAALLVIKLFRTPAPRITSDMGFWQRLKARVVRLGYLLLALMTSGLLLAIAVLGLRVGFGSLMRLLLGA